VAFSYNSVGVGREGQKGSLPTFAALAQTTQKDRLLNAWLYASSH
jgi:hypothetical protein